MSHNENPAKKQQTSLFSTTSPKVIAGCILTLMVVVLWVGSSVLSQFIFDNADFGKPMFMTIFNSGLFALYLFGFLFFDNWRTDGFPNPVASHTSEEDEDPGAIDGTEDASYPLLPAEISKAPSEGNVKQSNSKSKSRQNQSQPKQAPLPYTKQDSIVANSDDEDEANESDPLKEAILAVAAADAEVGEANKPSSIRGRPPPTRLPWPKVAELAFWYFWIWLLGSYTYNLSLCFACGCGTSVSVHTVISGTSALFALVVGCVLLNDTRSATLTNFVAAAVSTAGAALITGVDFAPGAGNTWQGDLLCAASAVCHGLSSVLLKKWIPDDDAVCMEMFFGFLGLWNLVVGIPLLFLMHYMGWETFQLLTQTAAFCLIFNAVLGTVVSNVLWAKAVVLTSPLLVNLGTTLTVPLAFAADALSPYATHFKFQWQYAAGAVMVLGAFLCVNVAEESAAQEAMLSREGSESVFSDDDRRSRSVSLCANPIIDGPWARAPIHRPTTTRWSEIGDLDFQI